MKRNIGQDSGDLNKKPNQPKYYVAIGTSAGGLETLKLFFKSMPKDSGAAFIIIQHLSPDFKSVMPDLLSHETDMNISTAEENMQVEENHIYLIPSRKNMIIIDGRLALIDQPEEKSTNFPIDIFFRSLAEDQLHHSIGIILSGSGSDGSRGIQAIKEVNGLVIVQEPSTAKFDGMPYNAVNTGIPDVVLEVEKIPSQITSYMAHPILNLEEASATQESKGQRQPFQEILKLLEEKSNIDFTGYKTATVLRRIERRIGVNQLKGLHEYFSFLLQQPDEVQLLAKDMLIGVTRFFRDPDYFKALEQRVIPELLRHPPKEEPIRIWVAGCSTGEEAYSVAILIAEALDRYGQSRNIKIFATDADPNAIAEASLGHFPINISEDISADRLHRYFTQENSRFTVSARIRQMIVFATHNLLKDPPFSNTQLTVCRNVLIYFQPKAQRQLLSMLHFSLQKGGYLFLGSSESLGELVNYFETINERYRLFKKVVATPLIYRNSSTHCTVESVGSPPSLDTLLSGYQKRHKLQSSSVVIDTFMEFYVPPSILVNGQFEVIRIFGDVSPYTRKPKTGLFSSEIRDIVAQDLTVPISTALNRAKSTEGSVLYEDVQITSQEDKYISLNLRVCHLVNTSISKENFLVFFEQRQLPPPNAPSETPSHEEIIPYNMSDQYQQRIRDLEGQLKNNQEHLQITIEELETTNEELQSSNEELLAANEELQSTNEELQSVNEELYTVNSEYHDKIEELTQANSDIDNLMKSTDLGIIFLDDAMLIRKFTPAATSEFNLMHSDINRPFHHISNNLCYEDLLRDISSCIETRDTIEKELNTTNGKKVVLRLLPYLNDKEEPLGVVLVISDMTRLRHLEYKLSSQHEHFKKTMGVLTPTIKKISVLIVDDNQSDGITVQRMLEAAHSTCTYQTTLLHSSEEALAALKGGGYDIGLIDYNLGDRSAFELFDQVVDEIQPEGLPAFILLSGVLNPDIATRAQEVGVYDSIEKEHLSPFLLNKCIQHGIQKRQMERFFLNT